MGKGLGALLVLLLLSGCTTVSAPEPGLSDSEWEALQDRLRDSDWQMANLPDDLRPPDPPATEVSIDDWGAVFVGCMNRAGFDNYSDLGGSGYSFSSDGSSPPNERLASYLCTVSYRLYTRDEGWFNKAQLDYLYDYYEQQLVPCLTLHGATFTEVPTREIFTQQFGSWHPFLAISEDESDQIFHNADVKRECLAMPPGIPDPGFDFLWLV